MGFDSGRADMDAYITSDKINDDRLYRSLDALLPHKDALCLHLQKRYGE